MVDYGPNYTPPEGAPSMQTSFTGGNYMIPENNLLNNALLDESRTSNFSNRHFGRDEDYIELNIYNTSDDLITHIRDFRDFSLGEPFIPIPGLSNEVIINPSQTLNNLNFASGNFKLEYRFPVQIFYNVVLIVHYLMDN
mgnify:CR=1 FL=1